MCGITGLIGHRPRSAEERLSIVGRMADAIAHRGPDSDGRWTDSDQAVALGHRRLAIVDLSPAGAQPMQSHCGRYVVAYNGEIYNHLQLRDQLDVGSWRGRSDSETLLAAFTRWGVEETLPRLVGMFAIAVWDRQQACLWLIRDRLGEKPLYWGRLPGGDLVFGSELSALKAHPDWHAEIDRNALASFMRLSTVPAPNSIYRGIHKLEAGCWLRIGTEQTEAHGRWWDQTAVARTGVAKRVETANWSQTEAVDRLEQLLLQAVDSQLLSDVPLGAFLSGGIDSSTIVALMMRRGPVRTFSIGFDQQGFDESSHARRVAEHLGTIHTEFRVDAREALDLIPRLPSIYDEPFADSSQIPTALVAALARQHVTVALSGDGGDELFAGYNRYVLTARLWGRLRRLPLGLRRATARALLCFRAEALTGMANQAQRLLPQHRRHPLVGQKLHKLARHVLPMRSASDMYRALVSQWQEPEGLVIGAHEPKGALNRAEALSAEFGDVEWMCLLDQLTYLSDDILVKVDRASMASALETRVPLLDHRVVEFAWSLPLALKLRDGQAKWLLRQVLYRHVPRELIERPKQGFSVPLASWLRGPLRDWAEDLLDPVRMNQQGFLNPAPVARAWTSLRAGESLWEGPLWNVLMWQAWLAREMPT